MLPLLLTKLIALLFLFLLNYPQTFKLTELIHAANERIPVEAVYFGTNTIYKALERF